MKLRHSSPKSHRGRNFPWILCGFLSSGSPGAAEGPRSCSAVGNSCGYSVRMGKVTLGCAFNKIILEMNKTLLLCQAKGLAFEEWLCVYVGVNLTIEHAQELHMESWMEKKKVWKGLKGSPGSCEGCPSPATAPVCRAQPSWASSLSPLLSPLPQTQGPVLEQPALFSQLIEST